ncbi:MAG: peroxiredoxin family protein [Alphaproteobacteria bacterium]
MNGFGRIIIVLFLSMAFTFSAFAEPALQGEQHIEYGLPKGTQITHDLSGFDQHGKKVDFNSLSGENGIVLYFIRSAQWCSYCIRQLDEISKKGSILEDKGYNIVVISHDDRAKLKRFTEQYFFPYPMISDPESEIIRAFGLLNTEYLKGTAYHGIAYPALYIIGYDGLILDKFFDINYKERLNVREVRLMLDKFGDYESVLTEEERTAPIEISP